MSTKRKSGSLETLDSKIVFEDEIDMKLLLLSLFAHDPCHDFFGDRPLNSAGVFETLETLLNELQTNFTEEKKEEAKQYVEKVVVSEFTNIILGNGMKEIIEFTANYDIISNQINVEMNTNSVFPKVLNKLKNNIKATLNTSIIKSLSFYTVYAKPILNLYSNKSVLFGGRHVTIETPSVKSLTLGSKYTDEEGELEEISLNNTKSLSENSEAKFFRNLLSAIETAETLLTNHLHVIIDNGVEFRLFRTDVKSTNTQYGGAPKDRFRTFTQSLNQLTLTEIVRWVLLYLDCADETNGVFLPKFINISTKDNQKKAKQYILNAQILILYCFYSKFSHGPNKYTSELGLLKFIKTNLPQLSFQEYFSYALFETEVIKPIWLHASFPGADDSIKQASEIIIKSMFPNNFKTKLDIEPDIHGNFIINNASVLSTPLTYCPLSSIVDPMSHCPISSVNRAIYSTRIHVENKTDKKYAYSLELNPLPNTNLEIRIQGKVNVPKKPDIQIGKTIYIGKEKTPPLSVGMVYKNIISNIAELLTTSSSDKFESFPKFIRNITQNIIEGLCVKSIGDWGQEVTSVAKFGAYAGTEPSQINSAMKEAKAIEYDEFGQAKRLGVAGDRPSAFRMIYMYLFANSNYINSKAEVGYISPKGDSDFIVYTPSFESNRQIPKKQNTTIRGGTRRKRKQKKSRNRKSNKYSRRSR